jgi:hypothetical protein
VEPAALEAEARARLVAEGKPEYALSLDVWVAVDTVLNRFSSWCKPVAEKRAIVPHDERILREVTISEFT